MQRKVSLVRNKCVMDEPLDILLYYWRVWLWEMPINGGKTCARFNPTSQKQYESTFYIDTIIGP